jgi:ubiquinone/menaquinone biosynthesis C-methylase UbiE
VSTNRIIQLDSSQKMLALTPREPCCLRLHADATSIPLFDEQVGAVVGFLIDPFAGLNFFSEAYRVLAPGGWFFATTPTAGWGLPLREEIEVEASFTRFVTRDSKIVEVPSTLIPQDQLTEMLEYLGFERVSVRSHSLPPGTGPISNDILRVAKAKGIDVYSLPLVHLVSAFKPNSPTTFGS